MEREGRRKRGEGNRNKEGGEKRRKRKGREETSDINTRASEVKAAQQYQNGRHMQRTDRQTDRNDDCFYMWVEVLQLDQALMEKVGCQLVQRGRSRRSFFKFRILEACVSMKSMHNEQTYSTNKIHM